MSPSVRVVVPVYNRPVRVREALRSVRDQTFADFEVVVADDGSSDETAQAVEDCRAVDPRIRLLRLPHAGAASARNAAIEASGEHRFVAFLDSDDLWLPRHLERSMAGFRADPSAGVCFSPVEFDDVSGACSPERLDIDRRRETKPILHADALLADGFFRLSAETCREAFVMSRFVPKTPSVVVRREAVVRTPWFNPRWTVMEDSDLFLFLAASGQDFVFDREIGVRVRRFGDSVSPADFSPQRLERWLRSVAEYHDGKAPLCRSDRERAFVSEEVASSANQLRRFCIERSKRTEEGSAPR